MHAHLLRIRSALCASLLAAAATAATAQTAPPAAWEWKSGPLSLQGGLDATAWHYSMRGTWWNLAATAAPTYDTSRSFTELWLLPKVNGRYALGGGQEAYGALSVGITQNLSADAFDYDEQGAVRFESASLGVRGALPDGWRYDLSLGRQPFTLGTGMLLTAGSANGYSWGGGATASRKAWGRSAMAQVGRGELTGRAFMVEPAEVPEARTDTRVVGVSLEWARAQVGQAGLAWLTVPKSTAIYPGDLAPLAYIENGRDGLNTLHAWADVTGLVPGIPTLGFRMEYAHQSNDITRVGGSKSPMRADAWLLGASYWAQTWPFAPRFSYHLARFSGDKPGTSTYERFDPMFWGNGLTNWWFGANGAYSWLNSNIRAHRWTVDAYLSAQDILQFQYVRTSADELNSAIQYGQGVRFSSNGLLVGVPKAHLSNEVYLQYAHVFSPKLVAVGFVSRNTPGAGLKATATQGLQAWTTFGLGLTANF